MLLCCCGWMDDILWCFVFCFVCVVYAGGGRAGFKPSYIEPKKEFVDA